MLLPRIVATALIGMTVCAVAACSNGSSSPAAGRTAPATGPAPAGSSQSAADIAQCSYVPSTVVGEALRLPVGKLMANVEGPVTVCAYSGQYEVLVRYQTGETAAEFAQARSSQASLHQSVSTVGGLGDNAYLARYSASKPPSNTLAAKKGNTAIFITSPASLGPERTLMSELLAKV
jgi:hypothetical protein